MSLICGCPLLKYMYCLGCARWVWQKCLYNAGHESQNWGLAAAEEFESVPRLCRMILANYETDIRHPIWAPPGGYGINPEWVVLSRSNEETGGRCPPYLIYLDHTHADIVLAIRGLDLGKESDYAVLLDNKLGQTKFDGGYVHNGLLKAAKWIFDTECEFLGDLLERNPEYKLTFAGHSLGAGIAALLAMYAAQNLDRLGNVEKKRIRCFAMAPARCASLNLAVRYADIINSVVLQDDFLPRTTAALENVFKFFFCLPCLLCVTCVKETCTFEANALKDPRRLYAPGRLYHIVERKPFRNGRLPPVVRTAVPVDGRFEHLVLSCNCTADHTIIWLERECQIAYDLMVKRDHIMEIPAKQQMEHNQEEEYMAALKRAADLDIPLSYPSSSLYGTFPEPEEAESSSSSNGRGTFSFKKMRRHWDNFVERLFDVDESGRLVLKTPSS